MINWMGTQSSKGLVRSDRRGEAANTNASAASLLERGAVKQGILGNFRGFLFQLVLMSGTVLLAGLLQFGDVLPVRNVFFSCLDDNLRRASAGGHCRPLPMRELVLAAGTFGPIGVLLLSELSAASRAERARALRRGLDRCVMHVFGLSATVLGCSVLQCGSGLPRPEFLRLCFPQLRRFSSDDLLNVSVCAACSLPAACDVSVCSNSDPAALRYASRSFPSTSAATAAYAAIALAVYINCTTVWTAAPVPDLLGPSVCQSLRRCRCLVLLTAFFTVALLLAATLVAMQRVLTNCNSLNDVAAGFLLGMLLSLYVSTLDKRWFRKPNMRPIDRMILNELAEIAGLVRALYPSNPTRKLVDTAAGTSECEYGPYMVLPKPELSKDHNRSNYGHSVFSGIQDPPVRPSNGLLRVNFEQWPVNNAAPNCGRLSLTNYDVEAMRLPRSYHSEEANRSQRPAVTSRSAFAPSSSFIHAFYPSQYGEM